MSYSFLLASTTKYGVQLAQSLITAGFTCAGVLTPPAAPVGRQKTLVPTPVATWATQEKLAIFFVPKKIAPLVASLPACDFLLVVDFGYYLPENLRLLPKFLALNVHPSALPRWRGSSPGQAVILHGETTSAVSFIQVAAEMDAGDLLAQIPFAVDPDWRKDDYYDFAFQLAAQHLPALFSDFAAGKIALTPQIGSPTLAPKLARADGFIADLFQDPALTYRKFRAFHPWPGIWTYTAAGKRLKILACHLNQGQLILDLVQEEGKTPHPPQPV